MTVVNAVGSAWDSACDPRGTLLSTPDPAGGTTGYRYDPVGNLTEVANPLGHITSFAYNALNQLVRATDPSGVTTDFAYDAAGFLRTVTLVLPARHPRNAPAPDPQGEDLEIGLLGSTAPSGACQLGPDRVPGWAARRSCVGTRRPATRRGGWVKGGLM